MAKKALVVDDSSTMRNMVSMAMEELDFEVVVAEDGVKAVDAAENNTFDIVITDINMPNMDGIELIRHLREETSCKTTPILVLTTEAGDSAKEMGKKVGATGWIVKPFNPDVLIAAVRKVCDM
jgi:two-component system chemotaxis response regulator CheY